MRRQRRAVADDEQLAAGTRQGHVRPAHVGQEADLALALERTSDSTTASFSRPWKPSTLSISRPGIGSCSRSSRTWAA